MADGDDNTQLTEGQVDGFVANNGYVNLIDTTAWDKNTADDFSGDYNDLSNRPWSFVSGNNGDFTTLTSVGIGRSPNSLVADIFEVQGSIGLYRNSNSDSIDIGFYESDGNGYTMGLDNLGKAYIDWGTDYTFELRQNNAVAISIDTNEINFGSQDSIFSNKVSIGGNLLTTQLFIPSIKVCP